MLYKISKVALVLLVSYTTNVANAYDDTVIAPLSTVTKKVYFDLKIDAGD